MYSSIVIQRFLDTVDLTELRSIKLLQLMFDRSRSSLRPNFLSFDAFFCLMLLSTTSIFSSLSSSSQRFLRLLTLPLAAEGYLGVFYFLLPGLLSSVIIYTDSFSFSLPKLCSVSLSMLSSLHLDSSLDDEQPRVGPFFVVQCFSFLLLAFEEADFFVFLPERSLPCGYSSISSCLDKTRLGLESRSRECYESRGPPRVACGFFLLTGLLSLKELMRDDFRSFSYYDNVSRAAAIAPFFFFDLPQSKLITSEAASL